MSHVSLWTHFLFGLMEALSVCSDHCRAMECRIREGDSGPGRNGRRPGEPIPLWPGSTPQCSRPGSNPAGQWRSPNSEGRYKICHLPGGQRPPGPDYGGRRGVGNDVWRRLKEGLDVRASRPSPKTKTANLATTGGHGVSQGQRPWMTLERSKCNARG